MAKIKVHELAKELELQSKDILSFLQEKGIEAKAAQSSLEEDAAALVRNSLGKKKAAAPAAQKAPVNTENAKPAEEKAQAPAREAKAQETKVSEETKSTEETKKKKKLIGHLIKIPLNVAKIFILLYNVYWKNITLGVELK